MIQPQVLVVEPPHPSLFSQPSAPPFSGAREVRETFLRGLLGCSRIPRVLVLAARSDVGQWRSLLRETATACEAAAVTLDALPAMRLGPDVVVTPMHSELASSLYLRQQMRQPAWPVVGMTHDLSHPLFFHAVLLAQLAGLREGDAIACCSSAAQSVMQRLSAKARSLAGLGGERLAFPVIPHGVDPAGCRRHDRAQARSLLALPREAAVFLYFGRIARASKADLAGLVRTFANIRRPAGACLLLAGGVGNRDDARYLDELADLAAGLGLQESVRFLQNPDAERKQLIYSSADVFVSPANSFQESFGLALLEAMAHALPIVASDWNGYRDIVVQDETGFLAPTCFADDAAQPLAELPLFYASDLHDLLAQTVQIDFPAFGAGMERLAADPALRLRLGQAGRLRLEEHFALDRVLRRYCDLWAELAERARRNPQAHLGASPFIDYAEVFAGHPSIRRPRRPADRN
ncbi:MAG: glycosyltransferase family 4 protein [Nevskia sp.]|nr:glycosyltransferase family 4 protein [Nevskia sp.]